MVWESLSEFFLEGRGPATLAHRGWYSTAVEVLNQSCTGDQCNLETGRTPGAGLGAVWRGSHLIFSSALGGVGPGLSHPPSPLQTGQRGGG